MAFRYQRNIFKYEILEPNGVSRSDGKRPAGMTIYPWKKGRTMVWDFTCSDAIAPSHIKISSAIPGKVVESAETAKLTKYRNLSADYEVIPIGVETFGSWSPNGLRLISEIKKKTAQETGEPRSTSFLLQAIIMAIQRGKAFSVLGILASSRKLEEIFYF